MLREAPALRRGVALASAAAAACSLALAAPAQADYLVNHTTDLAVLAPDGTCDADGGTMGDQCTLREAISEANNTVGLDTITFEPGLPAHNILLSLIITQPTVIDGNGSDSTSSDTIINGNDTFRLFDVGATTTFRDLRLQDGGIVNPMGDGGAAIRTTADLMLDNVTVNSNQITGTGEGSGAGILSHLPVGQTVTITDSAITNNTITSDGNNGGAGIFSIDTLNMTNSTVSGNAITAGTGTAGGGIVASTDLSIQRSTISGNSLFSGTSFGATGGGIHASTNVGVKTIANSTISTNTAGTAASGNGGGANFDGPATVTNTTFEDNNAIVGGDDLHVGVATVTVQNTIFGSGGSACSGSVMSATPGNNLDDGFSCMLGNTNGNRDDTDAMLGPLMLNAPGTTMTHALLPLSPAIDAATVGPASDQRGVPRPQGTFCDIGAFERVGTNNAPSCAGFPAVVPPVVTPTPAPAAPAAPRKKCKKGRKLKKGKCVKKKRKKKKK